MRYLKLLKVLYKNSLLSELEYRVSFLANAFMSLFWVVFAIISTGILFYHGSRLGDWTWNQVLVVIGLYTFFGGLMEALLRPNVGAVIEEIREGTFDFVLTKPIDSQFIASLGKITLWRLVDAFLGVGLIIYALRQMDVVPSTTQILMFLVMILSASLIVYCIWLFMVTLAFWFIKIDNITELFDAFYQAGRFPITIYHGWVRGLLTFLVPVAFITTFPASTLLGLTEPNYLVWSVGIAILLFLATNRFWNFAVRHYSSASS